MDILTKKELLSYSQAKKIDVKINESLKIFNSENKQNKVTIFLSHKHNEKEELEAAVSFLKQFDVDVYVDWMDEEMPKHTSGETANKIKNKIKENDKFIFLATDGAIDSKWCNWELGYGDAQKYGNNNVAILPVKLNNKQQYNGSEYLQIYPYIDKTENTFSDCRYTINFPTGKKMGLDEWLKK